MKIGIASDTHRNVEYLSDVVDWLISRHKIAALYHLGDDYDDVKCLSEKYVDIVQVPGIYDERYTNGSLPKTIVENVLGLRILLVHWLEKDVVKDDRLMSDIILHGHTHKHEITLSDGLLCMNPGHLKGPKDKNFPPTFGLLDIQDDSLSAKIFDLNFKPVLSMELLRAENRLYKS
jgi:putative phosphoesterase